MMSRCLSRFCLLSLLAAILVAASGCGAKTSLVNGRVVKDGKPLKLSAKGMVVLALYPENSKDAKSQFPAETKPDGTFTVVGPDRKGIPAGKYRVAVQVFDPYPNTEILGGKYTVDKSTIVKDVNGTDELTIDVGTGK